MRPRARTSSHIPRLAILTSLLALWACADDGVGDNDASSSSGTTAGPSTATTDASSSTTDSSGSLTVATTTTATSDAAASGDLSSSDDGASTDGGTPTRVGICGLRSQATVTVDVYEGWEEFYVIGDEGFGEPQCVVRYDVQRTGDAPAGCDNCLWSHHIERSNPEVLIDIDGTCAGSELGLDQARIEDLAEETFDYGYVPDYYGHNAVFKVYDVETSTWKTGDFAQWIEDIETLTFDQRLGFCNY